MCGRCTLRSRPEAIAEAFDVPEMPELSPRYNIAPTQDVPVVRAVEQREGISWDRVREIAEVGLHGEHPDPRAEG